MIYENHPDIVIAAAQGPRALIVRRAPGSAPPPWEEENSVIEIVSWDDRIGPGTPTRDPLAWLERQAKSANPGEAKDAQTEYMRPKRSHVETEAPQARRPLYMETLARIIGQKYFIRQIWLEEKAGKVQAHILDASAPALVLTPVGYVIAERESC